MSTELTGPATIKDCPRITLKGNSYQRGLQYGRAFRDHLPVFYDWFVKSAPEELLSGEYEAVIEQLETTAHEHFPLLFDELKGWADGSGLTYDQCRLLAFHNDVRPLLQPGCSNVLVTSGPEGPWLARTCDLFEEERSWQVVRVCHCDDCHSYVGTTYLGLATAIGVNDAGLVVGGSSCSSVAPAKVEGLANSALYILAMQASVQVCCRFAKEVGFTGKGANTAVLDGTGDAAVIEYGGGTLAIRRPGETRVMAVTNFSVSGKAEPSQGVLDLMENSRCRYDRLLEIVGGASWQERTTGLAQRALGDREAEHPVCQRIPGSYHTIYATVAKPAGRNSELQFCWGYPDERPFETIRLSGYH